MPIYLEVEKNIEKLLITTITSFHRKIKREKNKTINHMKKLFHKDKTLNKRKKKKKEEKNPSCL